MSIKGARTQSELLNVQCTLIAHFEYVMKHNSTRAMYGNIYACVYTYAFHEICAPTCVVSDLGEGTNGVATRGVARKTKIMKMFQLAPS